MLLLYLFIYYMYTFILLFTNYFILNYSNLNYLVFLPVLALQSEVLMRKIWTLIELQEVGVRVPESTEWTAKVIMPLFYKL